MIQIRIDVFLHGDEAIESKLDQVLEGIAGLQAQGVIEMKEMDDLAEQVKENTSVDQSAVVLLNGLSAQITALQNDPAALRTLAASLKSSATDLAAAVVANTPAAPPA